MLPTKNDFVLAGDISNHRHEMLFVSKSSLSPGVNAIFYIDK